MWIKSTIRTTISRTRDFFNSKRNVRKGEEGNEETQGEWRAVKFFTSIHSSLITIWNRPFVLCSSFSSASAVEEQLLLLHQTLPSRSAHAKESADQFLIVMLIIDYYNDDDIGQQKILFGLYLLCFWAAFNVCRSTNLLPKLLSL